MSGTLVESARAEFVERFGGIYEHSPWVPEQSFAQAADADLQTLAGIFAHCVDNADRETKLKLIRAHPDLAGRAAVRGELTAESTEEQSSAGIDQCSEEEYRRFVAFNDAYKQKFGFPFVMAVRNSDRQQILAAFETRLQNDETQEFATAIREIHKIARLRLEAMSNDE